MIEIAVGDSILDSLRTAQRYRQFPIPVNLQPWQRGLVADPQVMAIVGYRGRTQEVGRLLRRVTIIGDKALVSPHHIVRLWLKK